jgi:hypothetical protein
MAQELEHVNSGQEGWLGSCLLWFFWGVSLSFLTILSLILMVLLAASIALNVYLGWELAGVEVAVSRRGPQPIENAVPVPTEVLAAIPTQTPTPLPETPLPTSTPTPVPTEMLIDSQMATIAAIATEVAAAQLVTAPAPSVAIPTAVAIGTPAGEESSSPQAAAIAPSTPQTETGQTSTDTIAAAEQAQAFVPPATSSNSYELIPIKGERESRPPDEHPDLNLKLREPVPSQVDPGLVEISGSGIDPDAIKLSSVFDPKDIIGTYAIHDWDWASNSIGNLLPEDQAVLIELRTTPGEPIFIPKKKQDIYGGDYYATVLYASEDSLTFIYDNVGNVTTGYTVHYVGLHTDPNLLKLFRESKGSELPGLTLDTPVGVASDKLLVAVRDKGTFMDARSKKDWWD